MLNLVRRQPVSKPIGSVIDFYCTRSSEVKKGDHAEVTDNEGHTLNIARVLDISEKDGNRIVTLKMIA